MVEGSLALLLELDGSDKGLAHVGQSLHGIKTISGGCSSSIDRVVGDSDGGSERADLCSQVVMLGHEIADGTNQLAPRVKPQNQFFWFSEGPPLGSTQPK